MKKSAILLALALLFCAVSAQAFTWEGVEALIQSLGLPDAKDDIPTLATREEIVDYLRDCGLTGREDARFYYEDTLEKSIADGAWMSAAVSEAGIQDAEWINDPRHNLVEFKIVVYYPEFKRHREEGTSMPPVVGSLGEAADHIWACGAAGCEAILFYYDSALDEALTPYALGELIYSNGVKSLDETKIDPYARRVELRGVTFYPNRFRIDSLEEARAAMQSCRDNAFVSAAFCFDGDLFQFISADNFRRLLLLENVAAMADRVLETIGSYHLVIYSNISYESLYAHCGTTRDIINAIQSCVDAQSDTLALYLTEALYQRVTANDLLMLNSMENNLGMAGGDRSTNNAGLSIQYTGIKYYPGARVLNAFLGNNTASLTSRETELLRKARQIVEEARANTASALELETALYDAVCDISRYQINQASGSPETGGLLEGDTAFGALLNGAADCDGYADAFYLLGNLAGFEVRYQHGDTRPAFTGETVDGTHLWNLIKLKGQWYMVDVTWGDREGGYPGAYDYIWLNMGADRALVTHIWDPETAAVPIAPQTDPDLFYFTRQSLQFFSLLDAAEYIANRKEAGQRFVQVMISGAYTGDDDFTDALNAAASGGGRYTYTTREIGEDVFLTVEWGK